MPEFFAPATDVTKYSAPIDATGVSTAVEAGGDAVDVHAALLTDWARRETGNVPEMYADLVPSDADGSVAAISSALSGHNQLQQDLARTIEKCNEQHLDAEGRRLAFQPVYSEAAKRIVKLDADAEANKLDAQRLVRNVINEDSDDARNNDHDRAFAREQYGKLNRDWLGNEFINVAAKPKSEWPRRDATLVRAVLDSADLMGPEHGIIDRLHLDAGHEELVKQSASAPRIRAAEQRAVLLGSLASTVRASALSMAQKTGNLADLESALGLSGALLEPKPAPQAAVRVSSGDYKAKGGKE